MDVAHTLKQAEATFLRGGGELGSLIRRRDWSDTPLGSPDRWPRSLKTAVRIMLASRQPIWIGWGPDLTYLYNDPYLSIIGGKHPWALGRPTREVWSEIWSDIGPMLATALKGAEGTYVEEQLLIRERHGYQEETYYTVSDTSIPDDDGRVGGIICANTEDTNRVIAERQLALLRELATLSVDSTYAAEACERSAVALRSNPRDLPFAMIYLLDEDGDTATLVGATQALSAELAPPALNPGRDRLWPISEAISQRTVQLVDLTGLPRENLPTGSWTRAPDRAAVLPLVPAGESGRAGALVVGLNPFRLYDSGYENFLQLCAAQISASSARAEALQQEKRRARALAEIDRAKTLFFSNVSHELRTPLTLMLGPMEDILAKDERQLPPEDHGLIEVAHRNGQRLLRLVNSLLDFSRVEAGRAQAAFEPIDLSAFTIDLADNFRSACERAGLSLLIDCPPLSEPVYVDPEMWEKVVLNLVSNAFKFTFEGGITVALQARDGFVELRVSDSGVGIPASEMAKVFQRFHRIENARARSHEGTGIGLALVQELVKLHGGTVGLESQEGVGTTFTVRVPLGRAHLDAEKIGAPRTQASTATRADAFVEEAMRWLPQTAGEERSAALTRVRDRSSLPRVLLADDNADMRDYVQKLLGERFDVEAVGDGEAAWAAAKARRPDLVLTDVMMPRLDGLGLLHALRADEAFVDTPIIFLSARAGEEARIEGIEAGADDYVVKPFSARELLARVQTNLDLARARRNAANILRESEARFRNMADYAPVMVWMTDADGSCTFLSKSWYEFTGQTPETGLGFGWLDATHPEDRLAAERAFRESNANIAVFSVEYRLRRHDGEYRWALDSARPRLAGDGTFLGYIGSVIDIHDRWKAEEHRKLLLDELNHRVKNTLAVIQGVAKQTFKPNTNIVEARAAFDGRLAALASAHSLLTRGQWQRTPLNELADEALRASGADRSRFRVSGPDIMLEPKQALSIAMAMHELVSNAVKYGALSHEAGFVELSWRRIDGADPQLELVWRERGGPAVKPPASRGFGSTMIERALAHELQGVARLDFQPDGVECVIRAPLRWGST